MVAQLQAPHARCTETQKIRKSLSNSLHLTTFSNFRLLQAGPLAKATSIILVEYPKRLAHQIPDTLCGLPKVREQGLERGLRTLLSVVQSTLACGSCWVAAPVLHLGCRVR